MCAFAGILSGLTARQDVTMTLRERNRKLRDSLKVRLPMAKSSNCLRGRTHLHCCPYLSILLLLFACAVFFRSRKRVQAAEPPKSPIHFSFQPIAFLLDSCESPQRHSPETMAG